MSDIYKTIGNENTQSKVVVSKLAKKCTKGSTLAKKSLLVRGVLLGLLTPQLISPAMAAFTANVTNQTVNNETVDGFQEVTSGGETNNITVINPGAQTVSNGGVTNNTMLDGGTQTVGSNGLATGTTINNNGSQFIENGGVVNGTIVNDGMQILMNGTSNNTELYGESQLFVHNASAFNTTINDDGYMYVDVGGSINGTTLNGGTIMLVGTANDTTAHAGEINAYAGSTLTGTTQINGTATIGGDRITNNGTLIVVKILSLLRLGAQVV